MPTVPVAVAVCDCAGLSGLFSEPPTALAARRLPPLRSSVIPYATLVAQCALRFAVLCVSDSRCHSHGVCLRFRLSSDTGLSRGSDGVGLCFCLFFLLFSPGRSRSTRLDSTRPLRTTTSESNQPHIRIQLQHAIGSDTMTASSGERWQAHRAEQISRQADTSHRPGLCPYERSLIDRSPIRRQQRASTHGAPGSSAETTRCARSTAEPRAETFESTLRWRSQHQRPGLELRL